VLKLNGLMMGLNIKKVSSLIRLEGEVRKDGQANGGAYPIIKFNIIFVMRTTGATLSTITAASWLFPTRWRRTVSHFHSYQPIQSVVSAGWLSGGHISGMIVDNHPLTIAEGINGCITVYHLRHLRR